MNTIITHKKNLASEDFALLLKRKKKNFENLLSNFYKIRNFLGSIYIYTWYWKILKGKKQKNKETSQKKYIKTTFFKVNESFKIYSVFFLSFFLPPKKINFFNSLLSLIYYFGSNFSDALSQCKSFACWLP